MTGPAESVYLLGSDAGYGFMVRLKDVYSKNRNGKSVLRLPAGANVLMPARVADPDTDRLAAVSRLGYLLIFPLRELTLLAKGKGLKIIQIPPAKLRSARRLYDRNDGPDRDRQIDHLFRQKPHDPETVRPGPLQRRTGTPRQPAAARL